MPIRSGRGKCFLAGALLGLSWFRVPALWMEGYKFTVKGARVKNSRFESLSFRVQGLGPRVWGLGFQI
jgi:hypothetical protein